MQGTVNSRLADNPIIRTAAKRNYRCLTGIWSRYCELSLMRTLSQCPSSVRYKGSCQYSVVDPREGFRGAAAPPRLLSSCLDPVLVFCPRQGYPSHLLLQIHLGVIKRNPYSFISFFASWIHWFPHLGFKIYHIHFCTVHQHRQGRRVFCMFLLIMTKNATDSSLPFIFPQSFEGLEVITSL